MNPALQAALDGAADALRRLRAWGWPAALGLALMLAAAAASGLITPALQARAELAQAEARQLRHQALRHQQQAREPAGDVAAEQAFRAAFAPPALRARRVAALLALAERRGLTVRRAEFRHQTEPALGLARLRITLPAEGEYGALRDFVVDSLRSDDALALDALSLSRAESGSLRAELRYTLLLQSDGIPPSGPRR